LSDKVDLFWELGVGRVRVQGRPLVPTNLRLVLPIALVQRSDELLERAQFGRLANARSLILETLWKTFVILAGQGNFIPTCAVSVSVEFDRVTGGLGVVLVLQGFKHVGSIGYQVPWSEKALKFSGKRQIGDKPFREVPAASHSPGKFSLEPIKRNAFEKGKGERDS